MNNLIACYTNSADIIHRKRFGQFFTHPKVAAFMVDWVLSSGSKSLYDPAFGLGAFYSSLNNKPDISFEASEIDDVIIKFWKENSYKESIKIFHEDYLTSWGKSHESIVCNPPYMRFQKIIGRELIHSEFNNRMGFSISGYTNMASVFLLKSLSELKTGGRLAYIMPLEFLNSGYGELIKEKLIEKKHLKAIINFDCEKEIFPDAITSAGIILFDSSNTFKSVDFYNVSTIENLDDVLNLLPVNSISVSLLNPREKWEKYFKKHQVIVQDKMEKVFFYGKFTRGIATGANDFFVSSKKFFDDRKINNDDLTACISKSMQISTSFFSQDEYNSLYSSDENVLLFSPTFPISKKSQEYIMWGEKCGYNDRFLTKKRTPWYKTEVRYTSPLLVGVFSRGSYKVIRNTSNALNLTCFHGFHSNFFGQKYLDHLFLYLFSNAGRKILSMNHRRYGDSLDKFEPNDLNNSLVPLPEFFEKISQKTLNASLEAIRCNECMPDQLQDIFNQLLIEKS